MTSPFSKVIILFSIVLGLFVNVLITPQHPKAQSTTINNVKYQKNIHIIVFNPIIENQSLISYYKWQDPKAITNDLVQYFKDASDGRVIYQPDFVNYYEVHSIFPVKADGFNYTAQTYKQCWAQRSTCHQPDRVDYIKIIDDFNLCEKVNNREIDEVWMFGAPFFGFFESALIGNNGFPFNGNTYNSTITPCNRLVPLMGFSYERNSVTAWHNFGHRTEATMTSVFGGWAQNRNSHDWDLYGLVKMQSPNFDYSGCGSIHFTPNAQGPQDEYRYNIKGSFTQSICNNFSIYPNVSNVTSLIDCTAWGCSEYGYYKWWFRNLPKHAGTSTSGKLNDWWQYIMNPNLVVGTEKPQIPILPTFTHVTTIIQLPTATVSSSITPTVVCLQKTSGDVDCNDTIDLADFEIFRQEFLAWRKNELLITEAKADLNADRVIDLLDFEMFRQGYISSRI